MNNIRDESHIDCEYVSILSWLQYLSQIKHVRPRPWPCFMRSHSGATNLKYLISEIIDFTTTKTASYYSIWGI